MSRVLTRRVVATLLVSAALCAQARSERVVDIPTRPGVTQRFLLLAPADPKAAVILFAGGEGGLQIQSDGTLKWGKGNFLVRSRAHFARAGLWVAVVDAPSDRQSYPFLAGFRQTREHADDVKAVIAWLRREARVPVWLVGTSRGTQSAAFVATALAGADAPDGLVLTSTVLTDPRGRPVPDLPVDTLRMPVLVVHHEKDDCKVCNYRDLRLLMRKLDPVAVKELVTFNGGESRGDPCEAFAWHGFNGIEAQVVERISDWVVAHR